MACRSSQARDDLDCNCILLGLLIHEPEILILDEPTAGADVELRLQLWEMLSDLHKQVKTILPSTVAVVLYMLIFGLALGLRLGLVPLCFWGVSGQELL